MIWLPALLLMFFLPLMLGLVIVLSLMWLFLSGHRLRSNLDALGAAKIRVGTSIYSSIVPFFRTPERVFFLGIIIVLVIE